MATPLDRCAQLRRDRRAIHHRAWFVDLVRHLSAIDVGVRLYAVPSVIAVPVIACEVVDFSGITVSHSVSLGAAAHPVAEVALRAALLEAAQTRVGCIAGARDDLDLAPPATRGPPLVLGLPLVPARPRDFATLWPRPRARTDAGRVRGLVAALAAAGYPLVARAILSPSGCAITTAKLFVPVSAIIAVAGVRMTDYTRDRIVVFAGPVLPGSCWRHRSSAWRPRGPATCCGSPRRRRAPSS